mmetsp:Transcript_68204/g.135182  ORF Transcript_68204/g.135182 Transcript_68204/m.135182 type:complete len:223 (-) Transcript_68204:79-747(-)
MSPSVASLPRPGEREMILQKPLPLSGWFHRYTRQCSRADTARDISRIVPKSDASDWRKRQLRPIASLRDHSLMRENPSEIHTSGASSPRRSEREKATLAACSAAVSTFCSMRHLNHRQELGTQCTKRSASSRAVGGPERGLKFLENTPPAVECLSGEGLVTVAVWLAALTFVPPRTAAGSAILGGALPSRSTLCSTRSSLRSESSTDQYVRRSKSKGTTSMA